MDRQRNESMQQYRGRQKREKNAANDALNLQPGEPIYYGSRKTRYRVGMLDKLRPSKVTRLEGEELAAFLAKEKEEQARQSRFDADRKAREVFQAIPHVRDAQAIRWAIETELEKIIDRLTPAEWAEFRKKLEA